MGWKLCTGGCRKCRNNASAPYGRPYYQWKPLGTQPSRSELKELEFDLHGRRCPEEGLVAFDPRAGEPKKPNTSGGGYRTGGERIGFVFRDGMKPADQHYTQIKAGFSQKRDIFSPERTEFSDTGTPLRAFSPGGTGYEAGPSYGNFLMLHSTYETPWDSFDQYGTNQPLLKQPQPAFKRLAKTTDAITITPKIVQQMSGTRQQEGKNTGSVMGMSALEAAQKANINPTGEWAWMHLIAYALGGINGYPDVPGNLIAGTHECNIHHLVAESAVKKLILDQNTSLTITYKLHGWYNLDWHVVEFLDYKVSVPNQPNRSYKFKFKCFRTEIGYGGDVEIVFNVLKQHLFG
jgi:hypothetical protein